MRYRLTVFFLVHFLQFSHIIEKFGIAFEICQRFGVGLLDFFVNLHGNKRHICQFVPFLALPRGFLRKRHNGLRNGCRDRFGAWGKHFFEGLFFPGQRHKRIAHVQCVIAFTRWKFFFHRVQLFFRIRGSDDRNCSKKHQHGNPNIQCSFKFWFHFFLIKALRHRRRWSRQMLKRAWKLYPLSRR